MLLVALGALLAGLSVVLAPNTKADATNTDSAFLTALTSRHVPLPGGATGAINAIMVGHNVCERIGNGDTPGDVVTEVQLANKSFTSANARNVVGASVEAYCPQYNDSTG